MLRLNEAPILRYLFQYVKTTKDDRIFEGDL